MKNKNIIHQVLPMDFVSIGSLEVCSNNLIEFKYILDDNGFIPILIGKGEIPRIWIYAKSKDKSISIIRDNISNLSNVKINIYSKEKRICVEHMTNSKDNAVLINLVFKNELAVITDLDLRPLGYNIYGSENALFFGDSSMRGNTFQGSNSLIKIGPGNS
jgi:hypothetical protein